MSIQHLIIHEVQRDENGAIVKKHLREKENSTEGIGNDLTSALITLFSNSSLNIGEFGVDGDKHVKPPFEQYLEKNYNLDKLECLDFVSLTKSLAERYETIISEAALSNVKGGIIVFYQYEFRGKIWLAVTIVQRTGGIRATDDLNLIAAEIVDLDKLHLGAAVCLTDWNRGISNRYIKFKTGRASEIRDYFEKFIGCQKDKLAAKKETKGLRDAIKDYAQNHLSLQDNEVQEKLNTAQRFIKDKQKNGLEISLSHIGNATFPETPKAFVRLAQDDYNVSESVLINNAELRRFSRISGSEGKMSMSFDRELLGSSVIYNEVVESITFTKIPKLVKQEVVEEMESRRRSEP